MEHVLHAAFQCRHLRFIQEFGNVGEREEGGQLLALFGGSVGSYD